MNHYVYKITNIVNGKYYIGKHSAEELDDGYMGSGIAIKDAIDKYGIENFKKTILKTFPTSDEAFEYEAELVTMKEVNDPMCYNLMPGGKGGQKIYSDEELKGHRAEYARAYYQQNKEEIKEAHCKYQQQPEVKERRRERNQRTEYKEYQRKYQQQPEVKERKCEYMKEYNQSPVGKESQRKYNQQNKERQREYGREYNRKPERKEYRREYMKEYNRQNKESKREYARAYYQQNKESKREYNREYDQQNKERRREYMKEYHAKKKAEKLAASR